MNLVDHIKQLHEAQLFPDVKLCASLALSLSDHNPDLLTASSKHQILVYQADACYQACEYRKAEAIFRLALQMRKMIHKAKGKIQVVESLNEGEVKYRLHMCHCKLQQYSEALTVLEGISSKQRCSKVNMGLARLYKMTGQDRSAVTAYKEVLRECPMSLEAAKGLQTLGIGCSEVLALMLNAMPALANMPWLSSWMKAQSSVLSGNFGTAVQTYKSLDMKPTLRNNQELLLCLGSAQFLHGDYTAALTTLKRAHSQDAFLVDKMDYLAMLLAREKKVKELEILATHLMSVSENAAESWIAMGYFSLASRKGVRALYFAQKALLINSRNVNSLILKGTAFLELKKINEASVHFVEALRVAPHLYEAYKGRVDCLLAVQRTCSAIGVAGQACKQLGTNPRSLTLYASVLAKQHLNLDKAIVYLEKAIKMDNTYLDAVYILADILGQQQKYQKGIELLRRQLRLQSTCRLHRTLADFLTHVNEHQEALDQYSMSLSLDPTNARAREGMERVEKPGDADTDTAYDMDCEGIGSSENEAEQEGSDIDSTWSDIDFN